VGPGAAGAASAEGRCAAAVAGSGIRSSLRSVPGLAHGSTPLRYGSGLFSGINRLGLRLRRFLCQHGGRSHSCVLVADTQVGARHSPVRVTERREDLVPPRRTARIKAVVVFVAVLP
jgi:hypothetical protein